ncbi:hypothetical protein AgCh_028287 [Apium graveolens]
MSITREEELYIEVDSSRTTDVDRGVRELREEIHVTCRILEARLNGATLPGRGPDALMGWATEGMEDFERLGGPKFPWS